MKKMSKPMKNKTRTSVSYDLNKYHSVSGDVYTYPNYIVQAHRIINGRKVTITRRFTESKFGASMENKARCFAEYLGTLNDKRFQQARRPRGMAPRTHFYATKSLY